MRKRRNLPVLAVDPAAPFDLGKRERPLTEKQVKFIKEWGNRGLKNGKKAEAWIAAGYSPAMANRNASNFIEKNKNLNRKVQREMKKQDLTIKTLITKHKQLLDAQTVTQGGQVVPDNGIQLRALQEGYKLYDGYPVPHSKVSVERQEAFHISIEQKRDAARSLKECAIDAEFTEEDADEPSDDGNKSTASPIY